jgi:hypothetical protein
VWEEANDRGLVEREDAGGSNIVRVSSSGRELLAQSRTSRDARRDVPARAG